MSPDHWNDVSVLIFRVQRDVERDCRRADRRRSHSGIGSDAQARASPRGSRGPRCPSDNGCWARVHAIAPYFAQHVAVRGTSFPMQRRTKAPTIRFDYACDDRQGPRGARAGHRRGLPAGCRPRRSAGPATGSCSTGSSPARGRGGPPQRRCWTDAHDAHNKRLIARQAVLADVWERVRTSSPPATSRHAGCAPRG